MSGLARITEALDREADRGRSVDVWWRDDDAVRATPALERLLVLAARYDAPVAIAAIPSLAEPSLADRLRDERDVSVLVHGFAHANHSPPGAKQAEYGSDRPLPAIAAELIHARALLRKRFGRQSADVFVPPWNRIAAPVEALLPRSGYAALSALGPAGPGVARLNAHLDPVEWRGSRSLAPDAALAASFENALRERPRAIGLLTHHLVFDEALWGWCEALLERLASHGAVRFRSAPDLIATGATPASLPCLGPYGKVRGAAHAQRGAQ